MQIMVCGSIGFGGVSKIKGLYLLLEKEGFSVLNHIVSEKMDYSYIHDFRYQKGLAVKIVRHDLKYVKKADIIVVLANKGSYGTSIEMYIAKKAGKKVILLADKAIPSPWPVNFSDYVVTTKKDLVELLDRVTRAKKADRTR